MRDEAVARPPFHIRPARSERELGYVRDLFAAYAASLPLSLGYQDFDTELADLPGKYAPPKGELLVAWDAVDRPVGCVAMRSLANGDTCEMKRLYVVPEARSFGLGKTLAQAVIEVAKERGYSALRLDTLPTMVIAADLYGQMGFRRIEAYYGPTPPGTIFMETDLIR